ncbi:MAG: hypothetical protein IPP15_17755 [Saprospiraceae bacterium]|uniref:Uncharacterized protein n=1 Tax=Candidatus Opimibacter skivensis TaxID=2982028 RepID=A0A9D7SXU8_9BACT|nr:hypothetical protein [Candidatus Opimibacter skivensis]
MNKPVGTYQNLKTGYLVVFVFMLYTSGVLEAQSIIGLGTRYDNSFKEWVIKTDNDDVEGELRMRWAFRNDWTQWDIRIGDVVATVEQKWKDDPNLWEIRCGDYTVNARTTWPNVFNRWKLNDGKHQFNWGTKYANQHDEWQTDSSGDNLFKVNTYWTSDPRDWVVTDNLPEDVSMAMKLAMIFIAIHFSTPKA